MGRKLNIINAAKRQTSCAIVVKRQTASPILGEENRENYLPVSLLFEDTKHPSLWNAYE